MWLTTPEQVFLVVLAILAHSVVGLVAIWAALGSTHWFVRVGVVGGVLALGLPVPAYDLMLIFLAQSVVVMVPLWLIRGRGASLGPEDGGVAESKGSSVRRRWQFSLLDLFLASVVVAAIVAFVINVPGNVWEVWVENQFLPISEVLTRDPTVREVWLGFASMAAAPWIVLGLVGLLFGVSALVAAWAALGRGRLWLRLIVLLMSPMSWLMAAWLALLRASGWLECARLRNGLSAAESRKTATTSRAARHLAKVGAVLLSLLTLVPLGNVYLVLATPARLPDTTLPDPNGYDTLVREGRLWSDFAAQAPPDPNTAPKEVVEAFEKARRDALQAARAALDLDCQVPLNSESSDYDSSRSWALAPLARAFWDEGTWAENQGQTADAVQWYLDAIRIARASANGGLGFDASLGAGLEAGALERLCGVRQALTPKQARELIADLHRLDGSREPLEEVFHRKDIWEDQVFGWQSKLVHFFKHKTGKPEPLEELTEDQLLRPQTVMRLLICDLAIRVYRSEHGADPRRLEDLVPGYLSAVPEDPFSEKAPVYRRTSTGYKLYSVGENRQDDGGQKVPRNVYYAGDILLD